MNLGLRQKNLYLLRYFHEGLGNFAKVLEPIANEAALIRMGQGKAELSDDMARNIETNLDLPKGWMDRDNEMILKRMTSDEYDLVRALVDMPEDCKTTLITFLHTLPRRQNGDVR